MQVMKSILNRYPFEKCHPNENCESDRRCHCSFMHKKFWRAEENPLHISSSMFDFKTRKRAVSRNMLLTSYRITIPWMCWMVLVMNWKWCHDFDRGVLSMTSLVQISMSLVVHTYVVAIGEWPRYKKHNHISMREYSNHFQTSIVTMTKLCSNGMQFVQKWSLAFFVPFSSGNSII